ncbi:sugar diacid recognition domain-containing protein [Virgibacillus sp. 179-BFC.A HS]|uniref:Sugar diacid recognition domain-containing protein n=1 Tax=Tigheibacillus jepli TaxID=3035914 RepID=A0ABU5CFP4_9BACI|nr:sugar diacid recognition domain-containing protein [Virgibacillus sp. 179-BFC.A HS]MDY0404393.1 sugar diacid recognition domain-containing protein [Virgibacillus sp. 179-BFC.A HS]
MKPKLVDSGNIYATLVKELDKLIAGEVIVTDENGIIVASTDPCRIGTFHEGAQLAMEQKCKMTMTKELSEQLEGVRKGVVLPIIINDKAFAVLGITGDPQVVAPYAMLVQKVAELFIQDTIHRLDQEKQARDLEFFVVDWVNQSNDLQTLAERGKFFNINIDTFQQAIMFQASDPTMNLSYRQLATLRTLWDQKGDAIFVRWGQGKWLLLDKPSPTHMLRQRLKQFLSDVAQLLQVEVFAGVGQTIGSGQLRISCEQASRALHIASSENPFVFEEDLRLDMLLLELDESVKKNLCNERLQLCRMKYFCWRLCSIGLKMTCLPVKLLQACMCIKTRCTTASSGWRN